MIWKCISPVSVVIPRKTKKDRVFQLNLNVYRNTHYIVLNDVKQRYKDLMLPIVQQAPKFEKLESIEYVLYITKNRKDISNVCCIVDKFFSDVLTLGGVIPDDNYLYLPKVIYTFGGIVTDTPYVEIILKGK